jgi:outer membrane murein-binding lipoprotein Lpp
MRFDLLKASALSMVLIGSVGLSGCATKGYVNRQIATVNARIDGIDGHLRTVEATSGQALAQAQAAAGQAQQNGQRIDQLNGRVDGIDQQLQQEIQRRQRKPRG